MSVPVQSPADLASALAALRDATEQTVLLAGGTDLMVEFQTGRTKPDSVVNIWGIDDLRYIRADGDGIRLGALTTCADIIRSEELLAHAGSLTDAAWLVGAEQIRARATIGGNLGTASPAADLNPVLLAVRAVVRLRSHDGERDVPAHEFLCGYRKTLRRPDELIESCYIPLPETGERRGFRKVGTRRAQSIAKVVIAASTVCRDGIVQRVTTAAGSVAAHTLLLPSVARELEGHAPDPERIERASRAALEDCTPIDDVRSTGEYRRQVLWRTLRTMLEELLRG